jgi:hypothetical protein
LDLRLLRPIYLRLRNVNGDEEDEQGGGEEPAE